jgi:HEPN domain-containing protein
VWTSGVKPMVAVHEDLGEADVGKLISMARFYLAEAFKHLERGDPYDAAEKVWASVKHATRALTLRFLGEDTPSPGETWRSFVTRAFMRAGLSFEDASRWAAYFVDVRGRLHGEVFYGLMYEEGEHRPLMEKAREYLELVEKLIFQLHVPDSCGHEGLPHHSAPP